MTCADAKNPKVGLVRETINMDNEKINLIGRWLVAVILACAGVAFLFTGKEEYAVCVGAVVFLICMHAD